VNIWRCWGFVALALFMAAAHAEGEIVDPTKNVEALVRAEAKRQDDLREAETRRVNEQMAMRAGFEDKLRDAEAKRIDAIRAVDVNAVAVASQRAADQATVLASQVTGSSETLRALVASTAAQVATSQQQIVNTLSARITTLEQAQYEGKGKQAFTDPQLGELLAQVKRLSESRDNVAGQSAGTSATVAYLISGIMMLLAFAALMFSRKARES
jgi:uncharacterized protein YukE